MSTISPQLGNAMTGVARAALNLAMSSNLVGGLAQCVPPSFAQVRSLYRPSANSDQITDMDSNTQWSQMEGWTIDAVIPPRFGFEFVIFPTLFVSYVLHGCIVDDVMYER